MRSLTFLVMCINGLLWIGLSVFLLMVLRLERHGNYEYYGRSPHLYLGAGGLGFVLPVLAAWLVCPAATAVRAMFALPFGTVPWKSG